MRILVTGAYGMLGSSLRKIIEKNGGSIRVESDSSSGCTFIFSFAKMGVPSVENTVLY